MFLHTQKYGVVHVFLVLNGGGVKDTEAYAEDIWENKPNGQCTGLL